MDDIYILKISDLAEIWYLGVFEVVAYESKLNLQK